MTAYVFVYSKPGVPDPEGAEAYARRVPELIASEGGRFLVRGASPTSLEGGWDTDAYLTLLEFPSAAHVRRFYDSDEYRGFAERRRLRGESTIVLLEGFDVTSAGDRKGYLFADVDVTDPDVYEEYRRQVLATIEAYGGRYLVRGGEATRLEGDWEPHRIVVVEFDTTARAKAFYESPEYRPLAALRQRASRGDLAIVEGL